MPATQKKRRHTVHQIQTMMMYKAEMGMTTKSRHLLRECGEQTGLTAKQVRQWLNNRKHKNRNQKGKKALVERVNNFHAFCAEYVPDEQLNGQNMAEFNKARSAAYSRVKNDPEVISRLREYCEKRKALDPQNMTEKEKEGAVAGLFASLSKTVKKLANFGVQIACVSFTKGSHPSVHSSPDMFAFITSKEYGFLERTHKYLYGSNEDIRSMRKDILLSKVRTKFMELWNRRNGYRTSGPPPYARIAAGKPKVIVTGLPTEIKMMQPADYEKEDFEVIVSHLDNIELDIQESVPALGGVEIETNVEAIHEKNMMEESTGATARGLLMSMEKGREVDERRETEVDSLETSDVHVMNFEVPIDALHNAVTLDTTSDNLVSTPSDPQENMLHPQTVTLKTRSGNLVSKAGPPEGNLQHPKSQTLDTRSDNLVSEQSVGAENVPCANKRRGRKRYCYEQLPVVKEEIGRLYETSLGRKWFTGTVDEMKDGVYVVTFKDGKEYITAQEMQAGLKKKLIRIQL